MRSEVDGERGGPREGESAECDEMKWNEIKTISIY